MRRMNSPESIPVTARQVGAFLLAALTAMIFFHTGAVWGTVVFSGGDLVNQFIPIRDSQAANGWFAGWEGGSFSGRPIGDDPQTGVFYPLNWLYMTGLPTERVMTWLALFHFLLGGTGFFLFLRGRLDQVPALFGGLVWTFCGYQILRLDNGVILFIQSFAWVPWMLLGAEYLRLDRQAGRRWAALLALAGAMQFSIGAAQICQITWVGLGLWVLLRLPGNPPRAMGAILGGFLLAGMLALLANAPLLAGAQRLLSVGYDRTGEDAWAFLSDGSLHPRILLTWVVPEIFGSGNDEGVYWGSRVGYAEGNSYMGIAPLLLALFAVTGLVAGLVRRNGELHWGEGAHRPAVSMVIIGILGLLVALGSHGFLFRPLMAAVPTFDLFRVPGRWALWTALAIAFLGAAGLQEILSRGDAEEGPLRRRAWYAVAGCALVAALLLRLFLLPLLDALGLQEVHRPMSVHNPHAAPRLLEHPASGVQWALFMVAATGVLGAAILQGRYSRRALVTILVLLALVDLLRFWTPFRQAIPDGVRPEQVLSEGEFHRISARSFREYFYPETELVLNLRGAEGLGRVHYTDSLHAYIHDHFQREILHERPISLGLEVTRGYAQLHLDSYVAEYYHSMEPSPGSPPGSMLFSLFLENRDFLDAYNVTHILSHDIEGLSESWPDLGLVDRRRASPHGVYSWRNPHARGWAWLSPSKEFLRAEPDAGLGTVTAVEREATRWAGTVEVAGPGWLHLSAPDYAGWNLVATRDEGGSVEGATSRSVQLPEAGTWHFERTFRTAGTRPLPAGLALLALLAMAGLCLPPPRRRSSTNPPCRSPNPVTR